LLGSGFIDNAIDQTVKQSTSRSFKLSDNRLKRIDRGDLVLTFSGIKQLTEFVDARGDMCEFHPLGSIHPLSPSNSPNQPMDILE
jgi:hypothetical protein